MRLYSHQLSICLDHDTGYWEERQGRMAVKVADEAGSLIIMLPVEVCNKLFASMVFI